MSIFLNNANDIILDAVLTDEGRRRLAKGDGSFKIVKFALGDDEINYKNYNLTASSGLEDVALMAVPILEAFTNNAASLKNKLITIADKNLLYLPVLKLNTTKIGTKTSIQTAFSGGYIVPVEATQATTTTYSALTSGGSPIDGVLQSSTGVIAVDQGIDSPSLSNAISMKDATSGFSALYETEYNISIDSRFGLLTPERSTTEIQGKVIDDDLMATYIVREGNNNIVEQIRVETNNQTNNVIQGNQGSRLKFNIVPAASVQSGNLFDTLGFTIELNGSGNIFKAIRTSVKVTGRTTGYSVDIPVIFVKKA